MKQLVITIFENDIAHVLVDGEKYKTGLAKVLFGDWEKVGDYHEMTRRKNKGIHLHTFKIVYDRIPDEKKAKELGFEIQMVEEKFTALDRLNAQVEVENLKNEPVLCKGFTKAGKPCKKEAIEGEEFCAFHKKSE